MFHYDGGLKITALDLAIDVRRRQPRGFISHAHTDHMAAHELAFATPATAALYRHRLGPRPVHELPYGEPLTWGGYQLTTAPAGHILGAAMLHVAGPDRTLLYTGDFRMRPSATAAPADPPRADVLVMECTFGLPEYRLPPREKVVADLVGTLRQALKVGLVPVVQAYLVGKAQEVTRILTDLGFAVRQHPAIFAVSQVYEAAGCPTGAVGAYEGSIGPNEVLIYPPTSHRLKGPTLPKQTLKIAVTGWAADPDAKWRLGVDYAFPLSDHADYDELLECVERVDPRIVYCFHGPPEFVDDLISRGRDARWLPTLKGRG